MRKKRKIGIEKNHATSENQVKTAYLSIGSNLGDRKKNIEKSKYYLNTNNINIINCSNYYESLSWPDVKLPKYINIVIKVKTKLEPLKLFKTIKQIEKKLGRKKSIKNAPRTCDIDILDYNNKKIVITTDNREKLIIPHQYLHERNFVLIPFSEICAKWKHPKYNQNIVNLITKLSKKDLTSITLI